METNRHGNEHGNGNGHGNGSVNYIKYGAIVLIAP
jgi:hypothetical protein